MSQPSPSGSEAAITTGWKVEELEHFGRATELELASRRADGTLSPLVTMWVVRVGDDLYIRSAGGPDRPWYRHAIARGDGAIRADGMERVVLFGEASPDVHEAIDTAYHDKYDRYGPGPVSHVTGPAAYPVTIHLLRNES